MKKKARGRKKESMVLLDYRSWIIEVDNNFPSYNYVVRKKSDDKRHHVAYCGSLESALNQIYNAMLLDTVNRRNGYGGKFKDLQSAVLETKNEFSELLNVNSLLQARIKKGENETHGC
ncbi:MAG: hypothetical protein KAW45_02420 [Thermoplasmatales archaeon]|nr:hypothetical protein [Thermoplasmatales archaeon]